MRFYDFKDSLPHSFYKTKKPFFTDDFLATESVRTFQVVYGQSLILTCCIVSNSSKTYFLYDYIRIF